MTGSEAYEDLSYNILMKESVFILIKNKSLWKAFIIISSFKLFFNFIFGMLCSMGDFKYWCTIQFPGRKSQRETKLFSKREITWKYERKIIYFSSSWHANRMDIIAFKNTYLTKVIQLFMRKEKMRDHKEKSKSRRFS